MVVAWRKEGDVSLWGRVDEFRGRMLRGGRGESGGGVGAALLFPGGWGCY